MTTTIRYTRSGAIGELTLNRPRVLNAYSVRMRDELHQTLTGLACDDELRVLIIGGAGRAFCAGADLTEFGTAPGGFEARRIRFERDVWRALRGFPVPTIAALHGHVIGSGLELALHCTLRIAGRSARLLMPEAALGVLPAAGGTQTIARASSLAARMLLLGQPLDGPAALAAGLVDAVTEDADLQETVRAHAVALAARPRENLVRLVSLLRLQDELGLADATARERAIGDAATRDGG